MSWFSRFVSVIRSDRLNRDLDDEIRFHLDARTEEYTRAGLSVDEASARARRDFGSPTLIRDASRDIKLLPRIESMLRDVSFALRMWRRNKLATAAALVSLSLAIGACNAAFSLIDALILRALPVDDPQTLIYVVLRGPTDARDSLSFNYPLFREMRAAGPQQVRLFAVSDQARRDAVFDDSGPIEKVYGQWGRPRSLGRPSRGLQDQPREQDHHDDDDRDRHADEGGVLPGLVWHEKAPLTGAGIRRYDGAGRDVSTLSWPRKAPTNWLRLSGQALLLEERAPPDHDTDVARPQRRRPVDEVHVLPVWRHVVLRAPVSRSDERHAQRDGHSEC